MVIGRHEEKTLLSSKEIIFQRVRHHHYAMQSRKVKIDKLEKVGFTVLEVNKIKGTLKLLTSLLTEGYKVKTGYVKEERHYQNKYYIFFKK